METKYTKNENEIGLLWGKKGTKNDPDEKYLSGFVNVNGEEVSVLIFKKNKKPDAKPNAPDFVILKSSKPSTKTVKKAPDKEEDSAFV